ncbi:FdhF/YdeP family oxidoreductase [Pelagicoccus sp. SDUM812002]|uniref:FdhF/YdeP family oxidoreductase n=1 Tax=Pelagicoccus sp. SDUM812002 TaxID=3041266 RepID=UPI00280E45CD|nr:FdhF/YdeP family oxidoreductase [Pelagicoccus sp. SDUM812002]MDQ8184386.1 FdhF/YdeP family oxidoreductase [Pelagicoccus sp. SDUM812002]
MSSTPNENTPERFEKLSVSSPADKAGGASAVYHAMRHAIGKAGVGRAKEALTKLNQKGGFDCPSCAWPDPDGHRSTFEFCENGAKAVASETTAKRIKSAFFAKHSVAELADKSDFWHDQQGRLTEPMLLREGAKHYEPISWDDAFQFIANELNDLADPDEAIFYTSGRASNEAAFLYQLFVRAFGTNNLPDCSNMCHESSGLALKQSIGVGKGTVTLEDLREAELILVIGQNPGTNHPRMLTTLQQAKEKGARIVSINPLREAGLVAFGHPQRVSQVLGGKTPLADTFVRIRTNGDQALFQAIGKRLLEMEKSGRETLDCDFINEHTAGLSEYRDSLNSTSWETLLDACGLEMSVVNELAEAIASKKRIISCWAMGLTQHRNAVATIRDLTNLHLLRGAIGIKGAGLCPVRGHSNVQGDRTMGIFEHMPEWFYNALEKEFGIDCPREAGLNAVQAIRHMKAHSGRVFMALGGNFLSATPDTEYTASALRNCRLTVHVSTKLNRSHLVTGKQALILPCLGRSEKDIQASGSQWVSVENSMGIVHSSSGQIEPASPLLKSEVAIICGIASRVLKVKGSEIDWGQFESDYSRIRSAIERVVPGFENYNTRAKQPGGYYLPNLAKDRRFETDTKKANFAASDLDIERAEAGRLLLMTIRSHDQFNTTVYGMDDRYRGIKGERRIVFLNPDDMQQLGLASDDVVDVHSFFRGEVRVTRLYRLVPYDIPEGCVAMYFPEANSLVPIDHFARGSETPASKSIQVELRKR